MDPLTQRWCNGTGGHTRGAKAWLRDGVERRKAIAFGVPRSQEVMFELLTSMQLEEYWMAATETAAKQGAGWLVAGDPDGCFGGRGDWKRGLAERM